jgi:hypothetical protein
VLDLQEPPVVSFGDVLFVVADGSESRVDGNTMKQLFCFVEMLVSKKHPFSLLIMISMLEPR